MHLRLKLLLFFTFIISLAFASDHYVATVALNIRRGATIHDKIIGSIEIGDTIEALEQVDNVWIKIDHQGSIGYCSKKYLKQIKIQKNPISETVIENEDDSVFNAFLGFLFLIIFAALINLSFYKIGKHSRNKYLASLLALFLGTLGTHRYYLGQYKKGFKFFLFGWTLIPGIVGFWDAMIYLFCSREYFNNRFQIIPQNEFLSHTKTVTKQKTSEAQNIKPKPKMTKPLLTELESEVKSGLLNHQYPDDSIIDINTEELDLSIKKDLEIETPINIPPDWSHSYVYSFDELKYATSAQKRFYFYLKGKILNNEFVDIQGNTNYAFVLYFDLLNEYRNHGDIALLEEQFKLIGQICPRTKSYTLGILLDELRKRNDDYSINKLEELADSYLRFQNGYSDYNPFEYRLGSLYSEKLKLSTKETSWLNKIWHSSNVFLSIEACLIEVIKCYCFVLDELEKKWNSDDVTKEIKGIIKTNLIRKSDYYDEFESNIYLSIFKIVENYFRTHYQHNRKISDTILTKYSSRVQNKFDEFIGNNVRELLESGNYQIQSPSTETQIELNAQNTSRWRNEFDLLKDRFGNQGKDNFIKGIEILEEVNQKNSNIENIFFEASKFIAKYDNVQSLKYYAQYIWYDLKSVKFDNRELTNTVQRSLFKTEEQVNDFKEIIKELIESKNIEVAIENISYIYIPKRKQIKLDSTEIRKVEKKHEDTVELLNEFLDSDDDEEVNSKVNLADNEIEIVSSQREESIFIPEINLGKIHEELVKRIVSNSFIIHQSVVDEYAMQNSMFKNQLIDYINDTCMEFLDGEALIEEDEENYIIEKSFYQEISR